ncbi:MAG: hypothetical protein M3O87_04275 [Candidatus Dormibacteraeota bacterium]|nr:hypothetical protein [Candidatus Dormibacteraeota bacterium]
MAAFIGVLAVAGASVVGVAAFVVRQPSPGPPTSSLQSPAATVSASGVGAETGIRDHGPPPPGLPVVYVAYPEKPSWLQAVAWDGRAVGTVKLPDAVGPRIYEQGTIINGVKASPDGSQIRVDDSVYDQAGRLLGRLASGSSSVVWGDDNRHLCGIRYETDASSGLVTAVLWLVEPGTPPRDVIRFAPVQAGNVSYDVGSCAPGRDRVLIAFGAGIARTQWWLYRLSDGRLLHHEMLGSGHYISVATSSDATLIAANAAIGPGAAPTTLVQRTADGITLATFPGGEVLAFSGDSQRLIVFHGPQDTPTYEVREINDPAQKWTYGGPDYLAAGTVEPGGQGFAIALAHRGPQLAPCQDLTGRNCPQSQSALDSVLIVQPDGSEVDLGSGLIPGW